MIAQLAQPFHYLENPTFSTEIAELSTLPRPIIGETTMGSNRTLGCLIGKLPTSLMKKAREYGSSHSRRDSMINSRFRIYYGPQDDASATVLESAKSQKSTVTVPAGEVFRILTDALESNRAWLQDFEDDEVTISADLYEVMLAYQHIQRPSA